MAKKKKAGSGVGALLAKAAKKPAASKAKKGTPVISDSTDTVKNAVEEWLKHKQDEKTAESKRKMAEEILRPVCQEARRAHIQETGSHTTSVKLNGDVTYKTNKSYSKIPTDSQGDLEETFGDEEYERLFHVHTEIKLTDKAAADEAILTALIEAVGEDRFSEIFAVEQYIVPNDALIVERDLNPKVAEKHDDAVGQGLIKPYSASFVAG